MSSKGSTRRAGKYPDKQRDGQRKPDNRPHNHSIAQVDMRKALKWLHLRG